MAERRDPELIRDIVEAIDRIQRYTAGSAYAAFLQDTKTQDAVVRNLEVLGEAAKGLSGDTAVHGKRSAGTRLRACATG